MIVKKLAYLVCMRTGCKGIPVLVSSPILDAVQLKPVGHAYRVCCPTCRIQGQIASSQGCTDGEARIAAIHNWINPPGA